ncbi:MAG: hypothetical protein WD068_01320 [Candidatus Babeliales bacterium]
MPAFKAAITAINMDKFATWATAFHIMVLLEIRSLLQMVAIIDAADTSIQDIPYAEQEGYEDLFHG